MKVYIVATGRLLPPWWNADEFDLVAMYDNDAAAHAHAALINRPKHELYEEATVEEWDVLSETAARPSRAVAPLAPASPSTVSAERLTE